MVEEFKTMRDDIKSLRYISSSVHVCVLSTSDNRTIAPLMVHAARGLVSLTSQYGVL